MAHRIQDLERVPHLKDMPSVKEVKQLYTDSLLQLTKFPEKIQTPQQEEDFAVLVEGIYERHSKVLVQMARGAFEFRKAIQSGAISLNGSKDGRVNFEQMEETHEVGGSCVIASFVLGIFLDSHATPHFPLLVS